MARPDPGRWIEGAGLALAGSALALALASMAAQVISRYVIGSSLVFAEELARYALVFSTMLGAAVAYRQGAHVAMTAILDQTPRALRLWIWRLCHLIVIAFMTLVAWQGWFLAMRNFQRGQLSPALQIEIGWVYLAIPLGAFLIGLAALEAFIRGRPSAVLQDLPGGAERP